MKEPLEHNDPEMPDDIDFSGGIRGKYANRFPAGARAVILAPDVAEAFPDSESVNQALRLLVQVARRQGKASAPEAGS